MAQKIASQVRNRWDFFRLRKFYIQESLTKEISPDLSQINTYSLKTLYANPMISFILPCFNESATIIKVINQIHDLELPNYEIIVIDDGSTDDTVHLLLESNEIILFQHKKNLGYGKSLIDGIRRSSGDLIITIDSDGQHDPGDVFALCAPILKANADIVIGSRYTGKYNYNIPVINRAGEVFLEVMLQILYGQTVKNNQGGFRAFHRRTINMFDSIKFEGMAFTTEILLQAITSGYTIVEAPIHLQDRLVGKSRVKKFRLLLNLFYCFLYYSYHRIMSLNNRSE
jgi:glycosyltransferase involved in cell wall biosynthesis